MDIVRGVEKEMQAGGLDASVFARCTSRSDPSGLGRVELAQEKHALLEFSQSRL
jgi:hypothetical protein